MFVFDDRWHGNHGIGRFSREVHSRLKRYFVPGFELGFKPSNPFDFLYLSIKLIFCKVNFFSPGYSSPFLFSKSKVFTIHDLNHIDFPANSSIAKRAYYEYILRRLINDSRFVLTVSDFSKRRIIEWAGVDDSKVVNVGNGVCEKFSPFVDKYTPGYDYFLCVGNRKAHKNECRVIEAFASAVIPETIRIAFTGKPSPELTHLIERYHLAERVVFLGSVDEYSLAGLYAGALGLLFPSLYEGFGLPVVEAMACGVPVLTSNTTSLPEVAGDAALLVNPESLEQIRIGIERLVMDQSLRQSLIERGLERAKLFSWDAVADKVKEVLDKVQ